MLTVLPRAAWTTRTNAWSNYLQANAVHTMAIHWPGTNVKTYRLDQAALANVIKGFETYHIGTRGWPGIGYCYVVDWRGRVWEGAGDRKAAHSATSAYPNANAEIIGVQLILGTDDEVTSEMIAAVRDLYAAKRAEFPHLNKIIGHRDVVGAATSCPGPRAHAMVREGVFYPVAHSDEYVRAVQQLLNLAGESLLVDGVLGPLTTAAVRRFQAAHGLIVDGDPGPITLAALRDNALPTPNPIPTPSPVEEETTMPTPEQIATAIWAHPITIGLPDGTAMTETAGTWLAWGNRHALAAAEAGDPSAVAARLAVVVREP